MTIETDIDRLLFFNDDPSAWATTITGVVLPGIFDDKYLGVDMGGALVEADSPLFTCRTSDVAGAAIAHGDYLWIYTQPYVCRTMRADGTGLTQIVLQETTVQTPAYPPGWPWRGLHIIGSYSSANAHPAVPADIATLLAAFPAMTTHKFALPQDKWLAAHPGSTPADAMTATYACMDAMLDACAAAGIQGIVELNQFATPDGTAFADMHATSTWEDQDQINAVYDQCAAFAAHFAARGTELVGYNILCEPVCTDVTPNTQPPGWPGIQQQIVSTMRAADPSASRWNIVQPGPWAASPAFAVMTPLPFPNLVYSCHSYTPHAFTNQGIDGYPLGPVYPGIIGNMMWNQVALANATKNAATFGVVNGVPMWMGEFSAVLWAVDGNEYVADDIANIEARGGWWGWCYHSYGTYAGWDLRYTAVPQGGANAVYVGSIAPRWRTLAQAMEAL